MLKRLLLVFALTAICFSGCSEPAAEKEETVVPVKIYKVVPESIVKYLKVTGSITAEQDASVFSKVSEKLVELRVRPGTKVDAGQTLAVQYNEMLKQNVEMAEAAIRSADAQLKLTGQDYDRMKKLFDQKAVSQQQFEQIKTQKETMEIALEQAKTQLAQAKEQYDNSFIKAPFNGIVAAVYFEKDQMVPAGQPVVKIVSPNSMKGKLRVSGKDLAQIKIGQNVTINFPSLPDKNYDGTVRKIDQALDPISKTLEVEVQINDADQEIKSGMFGEFLITIQKRDNALVIPEAALMPQTEVKINKSTGIQEPVKKYFIFKTANGLAELAEVAIGISSNGRVEVVSGIKSNDSIVVVGQNVVREGQKVNVID